MESQNELYKNEMHSSLSEKTALLVIDMQKQYLNHQFPGFVPNTENLPNIINDLRNYFRKTLKDNYIEIFTIDCLMQNSKCLLDKDEIKISNELIPDEEFKKIKRIPIHPNLDDRHALQKLIPDINTSKIYILEKAGERAEYSAFGETWEGQNKYGKGKTNAIANRILEAHNVKDVYVVGLAYQQCVLYTAADAAFLEYRTFIVENATNSSVFTLDNKKQPILEPNKTLKSVQEYENEKVKVAVNNEFNGLPKAKDGYTLKIVKFNDNGFADK